MPKRAFAPLHHGGRMQARTSMLGSFARRMDPGHSSSCGVLFRLCETLCIGTDHFALRERMARTVACRTSIFSGRLPTSQRKTGAALRPRKSRGQSILPGGVIAAPDGLPILSSELPTSVATRATLHATHRPPMSSFCQITI